MNESRLRKADFIAAIILVLFSIGVILTAMVMPEFKQGWYAAPGFPPAVFGAMLLVMSMVFLIRTILRGEWQFRLKQEHWRRFLSSYAVRRVAAIAAAIAFFLILFGKIPFLLLSTLFLLVTIWFFQGAKLWQNIIISILTSAIIWYVFGVVFMVPLP